MSVVVDANLVAATVLPLPYSNPATERIMDGVLFRGKTLIPGADQFVERLKARGAAFLVLTNNPMYTPGDLAHRLQAIALDRDVERIFTSAMATARFVQSQKANGTAFVIGESGLTEAIHGIGYVITDLDSDYVVWSKHTVLWQTIGITWSTGVSTCR